MSLGGPIRLRGNQAVPRKSSTRYGTQIDAENAMYEYRKGCEPKSVQAKLDEWEKGLTNLEVVLPSDPTDVSTSIVDESTHVNESTAGVLKKPDSLFNRGLTKSLAMSSNARRMKGTGISSRNPMPPPQRTACIRHQSTASDS